MTPSKVHDTANPTNTQKDDSHKIIEVSKTFVKINSRFIEKTYSRNQTKNPVR
jgi:hypothetical protein